MAKMYVLTSKIASADEVAPLPLTRCLPTSGLVDRMEIRHYSKGGVAGAGTGMTGDMVDTMDYIQGSETLPRRKLAAATK